MVKSAVVSKGQWVAAKKGKDKPLGRGKGRRILFFLKSGNGQLPLKVKRKKKAQLPLEVKN